MLRRGSAFEFDAPDDWDEYCQGSRHIYRGPADEELIVSGSVIQGRGSPDELVRERRRLVEDGLAAMRKASEHPDLVVIEGPVKQDDSGLEQWMMLSETRDGSILFLQAIVLSDTGLLLVTLETPKLPDTVSAFRSFLRTVRRVSPC